LWERIMLRLLAAIAVVVMIVAICASLGEDRPAISSVGLNGLPAMLYGRLAVMYPRKGTPFRIFH
jgi:hypothetical protein